MKKLKLGLALSGGIDSSVSALLLKKNQIYIENLFMNNWKIINKNKCNNRVDYIYVKNICRELHVKLNILDFSKEYWNYVFTLFLKDLKSGRTPNPDILCNKKIKFDVLLLYILENLKLNILSTGHYAKIEKFEKELLIKNSFDKNKDQTYFLNQIKKKKILYISFPLAYYSKIKVRSIGKFYIIKNYNKKDSVGICFIGKNKFHSFIANYLTDKKGLIYTDKKQLLGFHDGLYFYTIGQRKSILLNSKVNEKFYVYKKDIKNNILYVTSHYNKNQINRSKIGIVKINFINKFVTSFICKAKIRHGINYNACLVIINKQTSNKIILKSKSISLSIGQYIVFYKNDICLGGAVINELYI